MNLNRIVFCLNKNPLYGAGFWNINSKIWKSVFKINSTVVYLGKEDDPTYKELSTEYGDVLVLPEIKNYDNWYVPMSVFYTIANKYRDEVCMTCGIDQIPLGSKKFINLISECPENTYLVGFGEAYGHSRFYPSSHMVAKGHIFKECLKIEDDWELEVERLKAYGLSTNFLNWGIEEIFIGHLLNNYKNKIIPPSNFFHDWNGHRLARSSTLIYDETNLKNNIYTELHSPRPFNDHKEYIINLAEKIIQNNVAERTYD
jgi:hypothetical protein